MRKRNTTILEAVNSESLLNSEILSEKMSLSKHTKHSSEYRKASVKINHALELIGELTHESDIPEFLRQVEERNDGK